MAVCLPAVGLVSVRRVTVFKHKHAAPCSHADIGRVAVRS